MSLIESAAQKKKKQDWKTLKVLLLVSVVVGILSFWPTGKSRNDLSTGSDRVDSEYCIVHAEPSSESQSLVKLPWGMRVRVLRQDGAWYYCEFEKFPPYYGWVYKSDLSVRKQN